MRDDAPLRPLQTDRPGAHRRASALWDGHRRVHGVRPALAQEDAVNAQLRLDLEGSHADATTAFREWLLSLPPTPWSSR